MTTQTTEIESDVQQLTSAEQSALQALRLRYSESRDLFSQAELNRMQFIGWLVKSGRLEP
jgi:hypothetical protein